MTPDMIYCMTQLPEHSKQTEVVAFVVAVGFPAVLFVLGIVLPGMPALIPVAIGIVVGSVGAYTAFKVMQQPRVIEIRNEALPCTHANETIAETRGRLRTARDVLGQELSDTQRSVSEAEDQIRQYGYQSDKDIKKHYMNDVDRLTQQLAEVKADLADLSPETHHQYRILRPTP